MSKYEPFRIAYVIPAEKHLPYTITYLGGPKEVQEWRKREADRETLYQANKSILEAARRSKAILMVQEQISTVSFTPAEREEIQTLIRKRQLADTEGKIQRAEYEQDLAAFYPPSEELPKTFWQRCQERVSRIWRDAFDSKN